MVQEPDSPRLVVVGANYRSSPVALRDRLFVAAPDQPALLARLRAAGIDEALVLATCDRVEIVAAASDPDRAASVALDVLAEQAGVTRAALDGATCRYDGRDAVRHLFEVASSLDSMITGEPQVLGQVKESHRVARAAGACGPVLDGVLAAAYRVAKRVRSETAIGERPVSIAAAAERLARNIHGDLRSCVGLLIGDGDMGELIAAHLRHSGRPGAGLGALTVIARIEARAELLARSLGCNVAPFEALDRLLAGADIVIAALATGRHVVTREQAAAALAARRRKPIFLIDAAAPGDVERAVNDLDGAFVYDLAELEAVAIEGRAGRDAAAAAAARMVEEAVEAHVRDRAGRRAGPAVARLRARFEAARQAALREAGGDAEAATRLLVNRLLHEPSAALRALAASGDVDSAAAERLLTRLFGLDGTPDGLPEGRGAGDEENET